VLSPRDAFELGTQLKTFALRVRAANANAARLATFLVGHRKAKRFFIPVCSTTLAMPQRSGTSVTAGVSEQSSR